MENDFQIYCKEHPNKPAVKYCTQCKSFICRECTFEKHGSHNSALQVLNLSSHPKEEMKKLGDLSKTQLSKAESVSFKCMNQVFHQAKYYCQDCKNYICKNCINKHDKGHNILEVKDIINQFNTVINDIISGNSGNESVKKEEIKVTEVKNNDNDNNNNKNITQIGVNEIDYEKCINKINNYILKLNELKINMINTFVKREKFAKDYIPILYEENSKKNINNQTQIQKTPEKPKESNNNSLDKNQYKEVIAQLSILYNNVKFEKDLNKIIQFYVDFQSLIQECYPSIIKGNDNIKKEHKNENITNTNVSNNGTFDINEVNKHINEINKSLLDKIDNEVNKLINNSELNKINENIKEGKEKYYNDLCKMVNITNAKINEEMDKISIPKQEGNIIIIQEQNNNNNVNVNINQNKIIESKTEVKEIIKEVIKEVPTLKKQYNKNELTHQKSVNELKIINHNLKKALTMQPPKNQLLNKPSQINKQRFNNSELRNLSVIHFVITSQNKNISKPENNKTIIQENKTTKDNNVINKQENKVNNPVVENKTPQINNQNNNLNNNTNQLKRQNVFKFESQTSIESIPEYINIEVNKDLLPYNDDDDEEEDIPFDKSKINLMDESTIQNIKNEIPNTINLIKEKLSQNEEINTILSEIPWEQRNFLELIVLGENNQKIYVFNPFIGKVEKIEIENNFTFPFHCTYINVFPYIYLTGGQEDEEDINIFYAFRRNGEKKLEINELPHMLNKRSNHSMIYIPNQNIIVVISGSKSSCEKYEFKTKDWINLPSLNKPRERPGTALINNYLYIFFGFERYKSRYLIDIERINIDNFKQWEIIVPNVQPNLMKKQAVGILNYKNIDNNDIIIIIGGVNSMRNECNETMSFDFNNNYVNRLLNTLPNDSAFVNMEFIQLFDGNFYNIDSNFELIKYNVSEESFS